MLNKLQNGYNIELTKVKNSNTGDRMSTGFRFSSKKMKLAMLINDDNANKAINTFKEK